MLRLSKPQSSHEELFMERYQRLRVWALKLVSGSQQQADDLLHDAFVHFMLHQAATEQAQNLDAYLHTMLRNLHLSQARRLARTPQGHLCLLDYDSADIGLQSVDPGDLMKVQDELRMICRYACLRKASSKAASVLILRYFHGYYPAEIARLLKSPRMGVDGLMRNARGEARIFLQEPDALSFMHREPATTLPSFSFGRISTDSLAELRQIIFAASDGECLSLDQIEELYQPASEKPIDGPFLSHLVSCEPCLERVNMRFGWATLKTRHQSETAGRDARDPGPKDGGHGPGGGSSGSMGGAFLKRSRRRTRQVFEHRPKELHISVNGFVLGTQTVSSRHSELTLNVNLDERIAFVEVYSERDVRLFFLNVELPPEGAVDQLSSVELSDGRKLDLALNFSDTWPRLHAVYADPTLAEVVEVEFSSDQLNREALVDAESGSDQIGLTETPRSARALRRLRVLARELVKSASRQFAGALVRPALVTLLLGAIITGAFLISRNGSTVVPLSSEALLQQAAAGERAILARPDQVIHRTFNLEERRLSPSPSAGSQSSSDQASRRRLELWLDGSRKLAALRVYDKENQLVSGVWSKEGSSRVLSHHSARLQSATERSITADSINFDDVWEVLPSAERFASLLSDGNPAPLSENQKSYSISYTRESAGDGLQRATLILSRPELRAIGQSLVVRQGGEVREFTFAESSFELRPATAVAPAVFEPEPELIDAVTRRSGDAATAISASPRPPVSASPVVASADLEVEALRLLNQAGADLGEQVGVNRGPDGLLRIIGVVETSARKAEIARALNPILGNGAVRFEVQTVTEVLARQQQQKATTSGPVTVEGVEIQADVFPAYRELRTRFSDAEARAFALRMISHAHEAMRHAGALKRLLNQFSQDDLKSLSPEARSKWLTLIRGHARAFAEETGTLRRELQPIFFSSPPAGGSAQSMAIVDDESLARAVQRLFELGAANERVISAAFATASTARTNTINSNQFWQSLVTAEGVANSLSSASDPQR